MGGILQDSCAVQGRFSMAARESLSQNQVLCLRGVLCLPGTLCCAQPWAGRSLWEMWPCCKGEDGFQRISWTSWSITLPLVGSLHDKFSWPRVIQWSVHDGSTIFCGLGRDTEDQCSKPFILHMKRRGHVGLVTSFLDNHG